MDAEKRVEASDSFLYFSCIVRERSRAVLFLSYKIRRINLLLEFMVRASAPPVLHQRLNFSLSAKTWPNSVIKYLPHFGIDVKNY
jgi:hypothetical protein